MSIIKEEFQCKNFRLDHHEAERLVSSRWQERYTVSRWYLGYRWLLALYHIGWLIYLFIDEGANKSYFFIYLTNWSYMMLTFLNLAWAINVTLSYVKFTKEGYNATWVSPGLKSQWLLQNFTYTPAMVVTLIYWLALYEPGEAISAANAEAHIMNSIFVVIDIFVSASPIRLLHFYLPVIYLAAYVVFSVIYFFAGGTTADGEDYIYSVLDWNKPEDTVIFLCVGLAGTLLLKVFTWLLYVTRELIYRCSVNSGTVGDFQLA